MSATKEQVEAAFRAGLCTTCLKERPPRGRFVCLSCEPPTDGRKPEQQGRRLKAIAEFHEAER